VERQIGKGHSKTPAIKIPFTAQVKNAIALANKEARALGHNFVGTEHIFLGLLRDNSGVAARVLRERGVDIETARAEVVNAVQISVKPRWGGLRRRVLKSQRVPIAILSSAVCVLLLVVAWHECVLHPF
jgi:ATP-dependent Clp protease ATP-binding subunit ClpC